jgi:hypothetical protein
MFFVIVVAAVVVCFNSMGRCMYYVTWIFSDQHDSLICLGLVCRLESININLTVFMHIYILFLFDFFSLSSDVDRTRIPPKSQHRSSTAVLSLFSCSTKLGNTQLSKHVKLGDRIPLLGIGAPPTFQREVCFTVVKRCVMDFVPRALSNDCEEHQRFVWQRMWYCRWLRVEVTKRRDLPYLVTVMVLTYILMWEQELHERSYDGVNSWDDSIIASSWWTF